MDIMSPGEKIKHYRKLLKISQRELATNNVSLSTIKLIESGKRNLTVNTAGIIVNNFNEAAAEKGVLINLSIKDLLVSELEYTREAYKNKLNRLEQQEFEIKNYIELVDSVKAYKLGELAGEIEIKIGIHLYDEKKYEEAIEYFKKSLDTYASIHDSEHTAFIVNKAGSCYYKLGDYSTAIEYFFAAHREYIRNRINDPELEYRILYNIALSHFRLSSFNKAMDHINKLLKSKNLKEEFLTELLILEAAIYSRTGEDEKALNIYESLKTKKFEDLHIIYHNIGRILTKLNRNEEGMKYLNEAIRIQLKLQSAETTMTLHHMGQLYREQKNYKESIIYLENALVNARQFYQLRELSELYNDLLETWVLSNNINNFEKYVSNLVNDIEKNIGKSRTAARLILILNNYLLNTSQIKRCIDLTNSLLKA